MLTKLFEPISIRNVRIKNRYVMAPMGNVGLADSRGAFTQRGVDYFVERARGGTGLIITGLCPVAPWIEQLSPGRLPTPAVDPAAFMRSGRELTERVHAHDSKIFLQLTAGFGYSLRTASGSTLVAPSPISNRWNPSLMHRALTRTELYEFIEAFAKTARIAQSCDFDGVEIHAVHEGYLLDQFTMAFYNHRSDEFGGDLTGRLKFPTEVVKAIKADCGEQFPVALRLSVKSFIKGQRQGALPGEQFAEQGRDIEEGLEVARRMVAAGYDALDVDAGTYDSWYWNHPPMYFDKKGIYLEFSRKVKKEVPVPVIAAGRMDDAAMANQALLDGDCDLVSLGRPLLADPELPNKVKEGREDRIRPCLSCHEACMGRIGKGLPLSCAVNPACGRELSYGLVPALHPKKVMVVGGGIAGMEVARAAAIRGHHVEIYEKSDALGGVVIPGGQAPFKSNDRALLQWYRNEMRLHQIPVHLRTEVTRETVEQVKPETVIVATGSTPIHLPIRGNDRVSLYTAADVLMNTDLAGPRVAIIGAGLVGAELALWLRRLGREVLIVEATEHILGGEDSLPFMNYDMLKDLLAFESIAIHRKTLLQEISGDSIIVESEGAKRAIAVDTVITSVGYHSNDSLYQELRESAREVITLGDAKKVHNIMYAIWDAYEVGRTL